MDIQKLPLSELHPAAYNPRVDLKPSDLEYQAIMNSINSFGYIEPIIWNKRTGNIIGGHQRYKILKAQGKTEAEVVVVDFDPDKEKAANLALNKAVGLWSDSKVEELLKELSETEWDMKMYNFDDFDLNTCSQDTDKDPRKEELDIPKRAEKGDVWILGRHRLICGDSTEPETLTRLMAGKKIDLLCTDPPYNVDYHGSAKYSRAGKPAREAIQNDNMSSSAFVDFLTQVFFNCKENMKEGAPYYIFMSYRALLEAQEAERVAGFRPHQIIIWVKDHLVLGMNDYHQRSEPILYGWKEGAHHYFKRDRTQDAVLNYKPFDFSKMTKEELLKYINDVIKGYEEYGDILLVPKPQKSPLHPTMKPVELIGRLVNNSSMPDNNVLDPFGGSGTTLIACEQLHRNAFLVEYEPHYCDCIIDRWEKLTGLKAVKEEANV